MEHEIKNHISRKHWKHLPMNEVPHDQMLRSTWTYRIKRNRSTGGVIKFKARFCTDGRSKELGINYNETCAPVGKWNTIRTFLTLSIIKKNGRPEPSTVIKPILRPTATLTFVSIYQKDSKSTLHKDMS